MKQLLLPDDVYTELIALAAQQGAAPEKIIQVWVQEQQWRMHARDAIAEYKEWSATHTPQYLTEEEFFAELDAIPLEGSVDADI